jgi:hypothetical protein
VKRYHEKYNRLVAAIDRATDDIQAAGMTVVNGHNRARGSTAFRSVWELLWLWMWL